MNFQECELGFTFQTKSTLVFFGKKNADFDKIKNAFSSLEFLRLKQTHSNKVVAASLTLAEADSHWTSDINKGLIIATADCIPIMIYNKKTGRVAAVHAGWRGVENQIITKTLEKLVLKETVASDFQIWIGPHILQKSFAVDREVLELLLKSYFSKDLSDCYFSNNDKFYVNLLEIVKSQISKFFGHLPDLYILEKDTKEEKMFHSFRRDKIDSGRNLSFISRTK